MILYGKHKIEQDDIDAVANVLRSNWLTCGPIVNEFEEFLGKTVDSKHAITCSNGTTAIHLALLALKIKKGDFVLVPAISFLSTANAVRYVGADVIFVDVDPSTGLVTKDTLEDAIKKNKHKNIKAFINVHLMGQCENLEKLYQLARNQDLFVIEDAAHAIGSSYLNTYDQLQKIGSNTYSDITAFSFHPVKTIAMGEGGAVTTNDDRIADKVKFYRNHGMVKEKVKWQTTETVGPWYYEMNEVGYNYRISDINCALGLSQLKKIESFKKERGDIVRRYDELFHNFPIVTPAKKSACSDTCFHLYVVHIDFESLKMSRAELMEALRAKGIGTQVHYIPLYKQPYYKKLYGDISLQGSEKYYKGCLTLPLFVGLTRDEQSLIANTIKNIVEKKHISLT